MLNYIFHCTLIWGLFALSYKFFFQKETFHTNNRLWLLVSLLGGLLLPLIPESLSGSTVIGQQVYVLPLVTIGATETTTFWTLQNTLLLTYCLPLVFLVGRFSLGIFRLLQLKKKSELHQGMNGISVFKTPFVHSPFSFFSWVFFEKSTDFSLEKTQIMLNHEVAHAKLWHTVDVLFSELVCAILWFHPLAWWQAKELKLIHEYEADAAAIQHSELKKYGHILLNQVQHGTQPTYANHFSKSHLTKRILMLKKTHSAPWRIFKYLALAPCLFCLAWLLQSTDLQAQNSDFSKHSTAVQIDTVITYDPATGIESVSIVERTTPSNEALRKAETRIKNLRALEKNNWVTLDTVVTFNPDTFEESITIVKNDASPKKDTNGNLVYQEVDKMPEYPGGQKALVDFMINNVKYPKDAANAGVTGKVFVQFIVEKTGEIRDISIKNASPAMRELEAEAKRVVASMPKWIPAVHKGKNVACKMILPVQFSLPKPPTAPPPPPPPPAPKN